MRTRTLGILLAALSLCPLAARADDTKPPVISDVKASQKGGKVSIEAKITDETGVLSAVCSHRKMGSSKFEDTAMVKNDYDDTFKVSFNGGADTEYFISTTDLLGNGPATYGSAGKPQTLGGKPTAVAAATPPPPPPPPSEPTAQAETPPPAEHHATHHHAEPKVDNTPPAIVHRKPSAALPDGQDAKLRVKITSAAGIKQAMLFARPAGYTPAPGASEYTVKYPITNSSGGGEAYEVTIPADFAHGSIEYFLMALDNNGNKTALGDPDVSHWFALTFRAPEGGATQPIIIASNPPAKAPPGQPIHLRAQASLPSMNADMNDSDAADAETKMGTATAKILYRTQDAGDQSADMQPDPSGGLGAFMVDLPAQPDGNPVYYQIVVCLADKCAIDTGSKHAWNSFTATNGDPVAPTPIKAVSPSAPAGLPE